jgi:hypothetical protein
MNPRASDLRFGISGKSAGQTNNRLPDRPHETLGGHLPRRPAPEIFLKIQPVFDLPFVADEYGLVDFVQDLPLIRFYVFN